MSLMRRAQLPAGFLMLLSCSPEQAGRSVALEGGSPARNESGLAAQTPVATDSPPTDGQWTMAAGDYANTRFSGLDQITTENAARLQVAWTFSTGVLRGQEAAPIVAGSTMYVVTPYPNQLHARLGGPGRSLL